MFQEKKIVSFVRRKGRKLSNYKLELLNNLLPQIEISNLKDNKIINDIYANKYKNINIEIGYGSGEHLLMQSKLYQKDLFIGCEPYLHGTVKLLEKIQSHQINNIFIYQDDAISLIESLPANSIAKIFILFPDPWPKTKHHKRRIINDNNITIIKNKLRAKGLLRIATDHSDYASWIIAKINKYHDLSWQIGNVRDWHNEPSDWIETKYQKKALAGKNSYFFDFIKIS